MNVQSSDAIIIFLIVQLCYCTIPMRLININHKIFSLHFVSLKLFVNCITCKTVLSVHVITVISYPDYLELLETIPAK